MPIFVVKMIVKFYDVRLYNTHIDNFKVYVVVGDGFIHFRRSDAWSCSLVDMILDFDIRNIRLLKESSGPGFESQQDQFFSFVMTCSPTVLHFFDTLQIFVSHQKNFKKFQILSHESTRMKKASLSSLKVSELKEMCKQKNLKVSGRKADLIERLTSSKTIENASSTTSLDSSRLKSCMGPKVFKEFHIPSNMALLGYVLSFKKKSNNSNNIHTETKEKTAP